MFTYQAGPWTAPVSLIDVFLTIILLIVLLSIGGAKKRKMLAKPGNEHYKYYVWNIWFKIILALFFGAIYMLYYKGGDTMAYWMGAEKLNNLFWYDFNNYWAELINEPTSDSLILHYNAETGFPPGWIYRDPNSFYVSKIYSVFMILAGQSYLILTVLIAYITAVFSFKVYEIVRNFNITTDRLAAIAVLFIPSVAFWCSGFSKDTLVLLCIYGILIHFFALYNRSESSKLKAIIWFSIYILILYNLRSFMLFTVLAPLGAMFVTQLIKRYSESAFLAGAIRFFFISFGFVAFLFFLRWQGEEIEKTAQSYLTEAEVQQNDFAQNETYGDKKYELNVSSFTPFGMMAAAPQAIFIALYRPGLWEARSPLLLISGIENAFFLFYTFVFLFRDKLSEKIKIIQKNELLVFSLIFVLILAFFAGFTSILFGVLVRFKAPLLPFLMILLTISPKHFIKQEEVLE